MHLPVWLLVVLVLLAITRLTRLINADAVLDPIRGPIIERKPDGTLAYFIECPWCVSIWVGAGIAAAAYFWPHGWWVIIPVLALAGSQIAGMLALVVNLLEKVSS